MHREGKKFGLPTNKTIRYGGRELYTVRNTVETKSIVYYNNDDNSVKKYCDYIKLGKAKCCTRCGGTHYSCKGLVYEMNEYPKSKWPDRKKIYSNYNNYIHEEVNELIIDN